MIIKNHNKEKRLRRLLRSHILKMSIDKEIRLRKLLRKLYYIGFKFGIVCGIIIGITFTLVLLEIWG